MNPIMQSAIGAILRFVLAIAAGYVVKAGIWTASEATGYVGAAALGLLALGWSLWEKYRSRRKLVTALSMPFVATEDQVIEKIAAGVPVPSVTTRPDEVPKA